MNIFLDKFSFWVFKDNLESTVNFIIDTFSISTPLTIDEILYEIVQTDEKLNQNFKLIETKDLKIYVFRDYDDSDIIVFNLNTAKELSGKLKLVKEKLNS